MAITDEQYVLFTTFRKSGQAVSSPVWIASLGTGQAGFTTEPTSGKVKRIRNNPRVTLQPCNIRGRPKQGSVVVEGTATVLLGDDVQAVRDAIRRKYRVITSMFVIGEAVRKLLRRPVPEMCAIRIDLDPRA
jgi:PPOX class probable F420-dependent enzyme